MDALAVSKDIDLEKYKNALLYFMTNANNKYLGSTKLNKLMYYLDFVSYRDRGKSVSGDIYLHLDYGPVPQEVEKVLADLKRNGGISVKEKSFRDGRKDEFEANNEPDISIFDDYELELLGAIAKEFELWDTAKIVEQTHLEAPWFYSEPLAIVDYDYANDIDFFEGLSHAGAHS